MRIPFESEMALEVNSRIFEIIYYGAVKKSKDLVEIHGPYSSFQGSPASKDSFNLIHGMKPPLDLIGLPLNKDSRKRNEKFLTNRSYAYCIK